MNKFLLAIGLTPSITSIHRTLSAKNQGMFLFKGMVSGHLIELRVAMLAPVPKWGFSLPLIGRFIRDTNIFI